MNDEKPDWYERIAPEPFAHPPFTEAAARQVKARLSGNRHSRRRARRTVWASGAGLLIVLLLVGFWANERLHRSAAGGPSPGSAAIAGSVGQRTGQAAVEYVRSRVNAVRSVEDLEALVGNRSQAVTELSIGGKAADQGTGVWPNLLGRKNAGTYRYDFGVAEGYSPQAATPSQDWYDYEGLESGKVAGSLLVQIQGNGVIPLSLAYTPSNQHGIVKESLLDSSASEPQVSPPPGDSGVTAGEHPSAWDWEWGMTVSAADFPDELKGLHMLDERKGWAYGMALWFTEDGGNHWTKRSPKELGFGYTSLDPAFVGASYAWYVTPNAAHESRMPTLVVHRTADGGKTWANADLPLTEPGGEWKTIRIVFADEKNGWVLLTGQTEMSAGTKKALFRTTDGGATWTRSLQAEGGSDSLEGVQGVPNGIVFRTALEGFLTTTGFDAPYVYRTADGGRTWNREEAGLQSQRGDALPPMFFGEDRLEGVLSVCQFGQTLFFRTLDGGQTWGNPVSAPAVFSPSHPERLMFLDAGHGFYLEDSGGFSSLKVTTDGGGSWRDTGVTLIGEQPTLHFISPEMGWLASDASLVGITHGGNAFHTYWNRTLN